MPKSSFEFDPAQDDNPLAEINIIPLVDVVLVLLIIFMITVPMMKAGVDVTLPSGENVQPMEEERIVITLTREKKIYIEDAPVHQAVLHDRLRSIAGTSAAVYLYADKELLYGDVMEFMDTLKGVGIETVALVMDEKPKKQTRQKAK